MKIHQPSFIGMGIPLILASFLHPHDLYAQSRIQSRIRSHEHLAQFSRKRQNEWNREHQRALNLCEELQIPVSYLDERGRIVRLQRLGYQDRPVYYVTDNLDLAKTISTNQLWTADDELPWLSGDGVEVNLWDGGAVLETHQEFQNTAEPRIRIIDRDVAVSNHSTHVAGTIGAAGIDELARGMAANVSISGWDFDNDVAEMAFMASEGISLSNHSYGSLCGWDFNSFLARWCWYGDTLTSAVEDYQFGFYDQVSQDLDFIAWKAPGYLIVKSAGNDRQQAPPDQPIEHYIWDDGWKLSTEVRDPDGGSYGYDCLTPMSIAKNILTVGALDNEKFISSFSAFGPTDDGRIKPDVVAGGVDVYSSIGTSPSSYGTFNGTSMAAASATGSIALLQELQEQLQPGVGLRSSTLKGILIHTAEDKGDGPGPDYQYGWGLLNIKEAADLLQLNAASGGYLIREGRIAEGESMVFPIETTVPASDLKVTLCWTDPPGTASDPVLNSRERKLVNDLDLMILESQSQLSHLPWKLDPDNPGNQAVQGMNHTDNVEQVLITGALPGNYQVMVGHSGSIQGESQHFSLIISGIVSPSDIFPPKNLKYLAGETSVALQWSSPEEGNPDQYRIYRNALPLALCSDTIFVDYDVDTDSAYTYYITCCYEINGTEYESLGSNRITAIPRTLRTLPHIIDFEEGHDEVLIKNRPDGWLWGDSDSLSCYYLRFEENSTNFIAANSYSYGKVINVNDMAATMPLKLGGRIDASVSFDYLFITDVYDAIDELYLMYKLPGETDWEQLVVLPRTAGWTSVTFPLPDEICMDGTQLGFYYDDLYHWGMGAGLDNITVMGEETRTVDFGIVSMTSPVSDCYLSSNEEVNIIIKNMGDTNALPGDVIYLQMNVSPGPMWEEQIILEDILSPGEILNFTWPLNLDLSEPGSYDFEFLLTSDLDYDLLNNSYGTRIEVSGPVVVEILNQDLLFCENDPPVLIQVDPTGGILSGTGISNKTFDPSEAGPGTHLIEYTYTDPLGCTGSAMVELEVIPSPEPAILNQDLSFCEDEDPVLIDVSPSGGILSGPGISGLYFDPAIAGVGTHLISYTYLNSSGCSGTVSAEVEVFPVPEPVINVVGHRFCSNDKPIQVDVSPLGGVLEGAGISDLIFSPKAAGPGVHVCTYTVTSSSGCSGSVSASFQVFEIPLVDLGPDRQVGLDDTIELEPSGTGTSFLWFDGTTDQSLVIITNEIGPGEHLIWVEASNAENCKTSDSILLTINANTGIGTNIPDDRYIYPNPCGSGFYLTGYENERIEHMVLYGSTGKMVLNALPSTFPYFDLSYLPDGVYILKLWSRKGQHIFKIIKTQ